MTHTKKIVFHSLLETLCNKQSENKKSLKILKSAFFSQKIHGPFKSEIVMFGARQD